MIQIKDELTREQFEAGHPFRHYYDTESMPFKYRPPQPDEGRDNGALYRCHVTTNPYKCMVTRVDNKGFSWHTTFLGKTIEGRVLFSECWPVKS